MGEAQWCARALAHVRILELVDYFLRDIARLCEALLQHSHNSLVIAHELESST